MGSVGPGVRVPAGRSRECAGGHPHTVLSGIDGGSRLGAARRVGPFARPSPRLLRIRVANIGTSVPWCAGLDLHQLVRAIAAIVSLFLANVGRLGVCSPTPATALVPKLPAWERLVLIGVFSGGAPFLLSPVVARPLSRAPAGLDFGLDFVVNHQALGTLPEGVYDDAVVADELVAEIASVVGVTVFELFVGNAGRLAPLVSGAVNPADSTLFVGDSIGLDR